MRAETRANAHLEEALESPVPLAHALQARMLASWQFHDDAVLEAEKAVALDENDATALAGLANVLVQADRAAEGLTYIEQAMRLDPHHPPSYLIILGAAQFGMEDFDQAAAIFERAVTRNPDNEQALIYLAASYGHLGQIDEADAIIETANQLRNLEGLDELSLRDPRTYGLDATTAQIELAQFGSKPVQHLVRAGLRDIPALKWQYLVTVHVVLGPGNTWFEVDGAALIDLPTAKSMYDRGALFLDSSGKSAWETSHVPGAVHLSWERNADPRYSRAALREVAGYDDEIVFYGSDGLLTGAWEAAKAVTWGYHNVSFFHGGVQAWKDAGYPVELGP